MKSWHEYGHCEEISDNNCLIYLKLFEYFVAQFQKL
jgi:hypothetical protein